MSSKVKELKELGELLKTGHISQEEFEHLKNETLDSKSVKKPSIDNTSINDKSLKEKIILKPFENSNGVKIDAPQIAYLNFKDISDDDAKTLKSFLELKLINREDMTSDEIRLGEKLFTTDEIFEINSERTGFNNPLPSITSLISLGLALFFLFHSVATILLGAGSMLILSFITGLVSLLRADSSKLDKRCGMIALIGVIFTVFVVYDKIF